MHADAVTLIRWCLEDGFFETQVEALLRGFVAQAGAVGVPIHRMMVTLRTLHPQLGAVGWFLEDGRPFAERQYSIAGTQQAAYKNSPVKAIFDGAEAEIHVPLRGEHLDRFPIARDLHDRGFTGYLALAVMAGDGKPNALSLATRAPGGFTDHAVAVLRQALPALGALLDRQALRLIAHNVCTTYIGPITGQRVLRGDIRRGAVERVRAAVWFSDLRGFTARTQALGDEGVVALLNQWFGVVGEAVDAEGGEILKFIGDAALVVFRVEGGDDADACRRALAGARRTMAGVAALQTVDGAPIDFGVGLHLGEVSYGNIGALRRLDFTVIGHTVNVASRLEGLCAPLEERVLASAAFARALGAPMRDVGAHTLKGVEGPQLVFALTPPAEAP